MANDRNDAMKELLEKEGKHLTDDQVKHLLAQYDAVFAEAKPYIERLAKIWEERIISMIAEHQEKLLEHVQKSDELDIDKAVDRIGDILSGANPEELWIYLREQLETKFVLRPNILRVRLILDNSGSMDGQKIEQCILFSVILSKSLERLTSMVNEKLGLEGDDSFFADTEIWKF
jgi:cobalamin biosynthesis protein CobT